MFSSRIQGLLIVVLGGMFIIFGLMWFGSQEGYNTANETIKEYVSTSIYKNRDDSARTNRQEFYLDKSAFETDVSKKIKNKYGNDTKITYDYMQNSKSSNPESIKAVRVYFEEGKEKFVTTNIIDLANQSNDRADDINNLQK